MYFITEDVTSQDYITLVNCLETNHTLTIGNKCDLALRVATLLYYLSETIGFGHWDFHGDNLFVKNDLSKFKIFDFDMSSTNAHPNTIIAKRINGDISLTEPLNIDLFHKVGTMHDMIRFLNSLTQNITLTAFATRCSKLSTIINDIEKTIYSYRLQSLQNHHTIIYKLAKQLALSGYYESLMNNIDYEGIPIYKMPTPKLADILSPKIPIPSTPSVSTVIKTFTSKNIPESTAPKIFTKGSLQMGGINPYYKKYLKYKTKYLALKNDR